MALLYHHFENGCFMADSQTVLDIRDDLGATMNECREVTESTAQDGVHIYGSDSCL